MSRAPAPAFGRDPRAITSPAAPWDLFEAALERLADPILLVSGGARETPATRRYLFANAAARAALPIERSEGPLATATRAPAILRAVEEALWKGVEAVIDYQPGGAADRTWRVHALPIDAPPGQGPVALLTFRDETEIVRAGQARADFLANASHELRTPLASLAGFIETLRGPARDDAPARDRFLAIMHDQAERMRLLVEDLLRLNQIELQEHLPVTDRLDLAQAAKEGLDALAPLAAERKVTVEADMVRQTTILADQRQVQQVIANLVGNAIKYSSESGRVLVTVAPGLEPPMAAGAGTSRPGLWLLSPDFSPERRYAALRVADNGPGIAQAHLPRLTERFYRIGGRQRDRPAGAGLGLAIVKHIMRRHGGGLAVESAEGAGAAFTAWFPLEEGSPV